MYNLNYNQFFKLLDDNNKLYKEFDKYMKIDWKKTEEPAPKSIIEMWRNNKRFIKRKLKFCFLVYKNKYIGSFSYIKTKVGKTRIKNVELNNKIYVKVMIVYIIPEYRKLGLAYTMLSNIVSKNRCFLYLDNNNLPAYKLYTKLGFKKKGEDNEESILVNNEKYI